MYMYIYTAGIRVRPMHCSRCDCAAQCVFLEITVSSVQPYDRIQVTCTTDEVARETCDDMPVGGRMWNPCYIAEVRYN